MLVALAEKVTESSATSITPSDDVALPAVAPGDTLRSAARYIEEHGWSRGQWQAHDGSVCVLGAIISVTGRLGAKWSEQAIAATDLLQDYLNFPSPNHIAIWNDREERTREEVLAALRGAAGD